MKILSLDTASERGSIALLDDGVVTAELRLDSRETHSARLLAGIEYLLRTAGWKLGGVGLVVAGAGPGSFTGIRIGVATAQGLAQSLNVPLAGISGLDAMAHQLRGLEGRVGVVMDAQRSQVYYAEYALYGGRMRRSAGPVLLHPSQLASRVRRSRKYVAGDGALRYAREMRLSGTGWPRLIEADFYLAGAMGRLALTRRRSWRTGDSPAIAPLYIRPPDALKPRVRK
jgi:tRNA threonylcarbamoyladenosine biosynthesis protein TsaB